MTEINLQEVFEEIQSIGVNLEELQTVDCLGKTNEEIEEEISKRVSLISLHISKSLNVDPDEFEIHVNEVNEQDSTIYLDYNIKGVLNERE
ncbi:hypothetical protein ABES80_12235 [Bacillus gobiensis]|uniref:hypothetical protein n=1 Tax=Bacillus gobiensis TaxID=1441095 RepID=UPI003D244695